MQNLKQIIVKVIEDQNDATGITSTIYKSKKYLGSWFDG